MALRNKREAVSNRERKALKVIADRAANALQDLEKELPGVQSLRTELSDLGSSEADGVYFQCGTFTLNRTIYSLEIFFDRLIHLEDENGKSPRRICFVVGCSSQAAFDKLLSLLPQHLKPVLNITGGNVSWVGGRMRITEAVNESVLGQYVEEHAGGLHYLSCYLGTMPSGNNALRRLGSRVYQFWQEVTLACSEADFVDEIVFEGMRRYISAQRRQRSEKLRLAALKHFEKNGRVSCAICNFFTPVVPKHRNRDVVEFHHKKPLTWQHVNGTAKSLAKALQNIAPLCPTCHRIAHSGKRNTVYSLAQVRAIIGREG